jgi:predicted ATP-binding protein involved in virulence
MEEQVIKKNQDIEDKLSSIPKAIKIKNISFKNFKVFDNYSLDFANGKDIKDFICFIGPNGNGKSTILNAIVMLFNSLDNYEKDRIVNNLSRGIRNIEDKKIDDFNIKATISTSNGDYEVEMNKTGFIKNHPKEYITLLHRICYWARFDQELNKFQLKKDKWPMFQELFEAVTGFKTKIVKTPFTINSESYVFDFKIKKPYETISVRQASDGEKKIIKSFSTLLALDYVPKIILVDNIEMHVDRLRHLALVTAMKKCFPDCQILSTTHSYYIKALGKRAGIYDTRMARASDIVKKDSWRFTVADEIDDCIMKLKIIEKKSDIERLIKQGKKIKANCFKEIKNIESFKKELIKFLANVSEVFVLDICK